MGKEVRNALGFVLIILLICGVLYYTAPEGVKEELVKEDRSYRVIGVEYYIDFPSLLYRGSKGYVITYIDENGEIRKIKRQSHLFLDIIYTENETTLVKKDIPKHVERAGDSGAIILYWDGNQTYPTLTS